jgi:hypothetical protein
MPGVGASLRLLTEIDGKFLFTTSGHERFVNSGLVQIPNGAAKTPLPVWGMQLDRLRQTLQEFPWRWSLHWLVAPCLVPVIFWPQGGPSMWRAIITCGFLGLSLAQMPWPWLKRIAAVCLTGLMAVAFIMMNFNLDTYTSDQLPYFIRESKWYASTEYLMVGVLVVVGLWLAFTHAPSVPRFKALNQWGMGILAVLCLAGFDTFAAGASLGSYGRQPADDQPFQSAVHDTGFGAPGHGRHNVVLVLVESLGVPMFAEGQAQFAADWDRPEWRARYAVSQGTVPYFGSTTHAEMRELCGQWNNYTTFDFEKGGCLPQRMKMAGYQTTAMHAFDGGFFQRDEWWSKLDFQKEMFGPELAQAGVRSCGGVFPGACDTDIPAVIAKRIKQSSQPQFVYWLTLNSHLPVLPDESLGTDQCSKAMARIGDVSPRLCRLFTVHHNLAQAISKMAMDPNLPPTDILIVGDHTPPFFDHSLRAGFDSENVPWVLLRAQDKAAPKQPQTTQLR